MIYNRKIKKQVHVTWNGGRRCMQRGFVYKIKSCVYVREITRVFLMISSSRMTG